MKFVFLILQCLEAATILASSKHCMRIIDTKDRDIFPAVCILPDSSQYPIDSSGNVCIEIRDYVTNKAVIRKMGFYDCEFYFDWEMNKQYRLALVENIIELNEVKLNANSSKSHFIGNKRTPLSGKNSLYEPILVGQELFLYFGAEIDTGHISLSEFHFYVSKISGNSKSYVQITCYETGLDTLRLYDANGIDVIRNAPTTVFFISDSLEVEKKGWYYIIIDKGLSSDNFIIGVKNIEISDKKSLEEGTLKYLGIGIYKLRFATKLIQYVKSGRVRFMNYAGKNKEDNFIAKDFMEAIPFAVYSKLIFIK